METLNCMKCKYRHEDNGNCTAVGGFCTAVAASHCPLLRGYLDTGLTPDQVVNAKNIIDLAFADDTSKAERIRKLVAADDEGRVVVLPCKLGATVYRIWYKIADYPDEPEMEIVETKFGEGCREDFGKTVFLTREEAKKALQEMEGKKDG